MTKTWPFYDPEVAAKLKDDQYLFTRTFPSFSPGPDRKFVQQQSKPSKLAKNTTMSEPSPWQKLAEPKKLT